MADSVLPSAGFVVKQALEDLRKSVDGLPGVALNWKPGGDETNSIAVLVTHVLSSTRMWFSVAVGVELPDRDRDSEFRVTEDDTGKLLAHIDDMSAQIMGLLGTKDEIDWSANRKTHLRPDPSLPDYVPAAFGLLHAIEHLGEHVAHLSLTRQLWEERGT